jgi:hypothetical protein
MATTLDPASLSPCAGTPWDALAQQGLVALRERVQN